MARFEMDFAEFGQMAERQPNADRLFDLGIVSATGPDGEVDYVAAHMWFNLAAARGRGEAIHYRQEMADLMSAAEIAAAQRAAREWMVSG